MLEKFTSRKFLMALISVITGVLGMFNFSDDMIKFISSLGLALIPTIIYIITEGKIDEKALNQIGDIITDISDDGEINSEYEDTIEDK